MPSTDRSTCTKHLTGHPTTLVKACDALSNVGGSFEAVSYLSDIGYDVKLSPEEKLQKMHGWNRQEWWDKKLLDRAAEINTELNGLVFDTMPVGGLQFGGWFRNLILHILQSLHLIPKDITNLGGFSGKHLPNPLGPNYRGISQYFNAATHPGLDFPCTLGVPVLAVADGKIVVPNRPGWRYDPLGWGYSVWIDHGNGVFTHYAHLMEASTVRGFVKAGDEIGKCGSTGNSTGPHVHFEVTKLHPDSYSTWNDSRAVMSPYEFLGIQPPRQQHNRR